MRVLITGGAGFIGTAVARRLLSHGCEVTVLDNFHPQIHGGRRELPMDISRSVRMVIGDVADRKAWLAALRDQDAVVHLAAETGTGQSMYEVERYNRTNISGTALLVDLLVNGHAPALRKIAVASSRAIYGEGAYNCALHGLVYPRARTTERMQSGVYDPICPICSGPCVPAATPETAPFAPSSFYGLTKQVQEQMVLMFAAAHGISGVALRYQNVFGPGQSMSNPYTGILAIVSNLARHARTIHIFEDGEESRDFVYIEDAAEATCRVVLEDITGIHSINVGSGRRTSILEAARSIAEFYGGGSTIEITGEFRVGDIRHNCADVDRLRDVLHFVPGWNFRDGLQQFLGWASKQSADTVGFDRSLDELRSRRLMGG